MSGVSIVGKRLVYQINCSKCCLPSNSNENDDLATVIKMVFPMLRLLPSNETSQQCTLSLAIGTGEPDNIRMVAK